MLILLRYRHCHVRALFHGNVDVLKYHTLNIHRGNGNGNATPLPGIALYYFSNGDVTPLPSNALYHLCAHHFRYHTSSIYHGDGNGDVAPRLVNALYRFSAHSSRTRFH